MLASPPWSEQAPLILATGTGGVAIGAGARAGGDLSSFLLELAVGLQTAGESGAAAAATELSTEISSADPDRNIVQRTWGAIKVGATAHEFGALLAQIEPLIRHLL